MLNKICSVCKIEQPITNFHKHRTGVYCKCKSCVSKWQNEYRARTVEQRRLANSKCYANNREKYLANSRAWQDKNVEYLRERQRKYVAKKKQTDVNYRLASNLRVRLCTALKLNYRKGSAVRDLGCSIQEFKLHLERLFQPNMSWNNYGEWEIDHIIPLSAFDLTDRIQLLKACHFSNMQPMWRAENRRKSNLF